jgi:RNA polymerase sigma factor (sigma-70 family)
MPVSRLAKSARLYWEALRQARKRRGWPMFLRLFGFLLLFLNTIMLGVLLVLSSAGVFQADPSHHREVWSAELARAAQELYQAGGNWSLLTSNLAEDLSLTISRNLKMNGGSPRELQATPHLLEHLLELELGGLKGALEKSRASGVFLLLDATVNPDLAGAKNSRACIYLKNMDPNIVSRSEANIQYGFGPMSIARRNQLYVLPQWQMEMDIGDLPYLSEVMTVARSSQLPLSRLYRWSPAVCLPNNDERVLLCAAPLVAADGTVFGAAGFVVSEMLFKLSYAPSTGISGRAFRVLAPLETETLQLSNGLVADSVGGLPDRACISFQVSGRKDGFNRYQLTAGERYAGLHQLISFYPQDSAYAEEKWALALMAPEQDVDALLSGTNRALVRRLAAFTLASVNVAIAISRRYIQPVLQALEQAKHPRPNAQTNIPEIDDLIAFLAAQDALEPSGEGGAATTAAEHSALYREFVANIATLSPAERAVFDLYVEGLTAREIAETLCLSINTIKTHNRRIYGKLNVTSRKELLVFVKMMKETGDV